MNEGRKLDIDDLNLNEGSLGVALKYIVNLDRDYLKIFTNLLLVLN